MRYLPVALAAALACVVPAGASFATETLTISLVQDADAFPILINVKIGGGTSPFKVHLTADPSFESPLDQQLIAEQREVTVRILSNESQVITVTVLDAAGASCTGQQLIGRRVSQDEEFLLDAARLGGKPAPGAWTQVTDLGDDTYCSTTPLPMKTVSSKVKARATWPGAYFFRAGPGGALVKVVVKPKSGAEIAIRGMCQSSSPHPLGFSYIDDHLLRMQQDGVNAIQFIKVLEMKSVTDTEIQDPAPLLFWDDSLFCAIRRAKAAGFTVMLRFLFFLDAPWPQSDNLMRGLHPQDWDAWFTNFEEIVLRYAKLAQDAGVDIYLFADSLYTTYAFEDRYRDLIAQLRKVFSGALVVGSGPWAKGGLNTVRFWDALDYIGLTGSIFTMGEVSYEEALRLDTDGVAAIVGRGFKTEVAPVARKFQKPLLWAEIYYNSVVGSTYSPNGVPFWQSGIQDAQYEVAQSYREQAKGFDATLRVVQTNKGLFAGVFCLDWPFWDPEELRCCSKGTFHIRGTPAEEVFGTWWGREGRGLSTPAPSFDGCLVVDEFSPGARGQWALDGSGGKWEEEVLHKGQPEEMPRIRVDVSNPNGEFFRLRYTLNQGHRDLSSYQGIALAASAPTPMHIRVELAMQTSSGQWIDGFFSQPVALGPETSLITLPFGAFSLTPKAQAQYKRPPDLDITHVSGVCIWAVESTGTLYVWSWGVGAYR